MSRQFCVYDSIFTYICPYIHLYNTYSYMYIFKYLLHNTITQQHNMLDIRPSVVSLLTCLQSSSTLDTTAPTRTCMGSSLAEKQHSARVLQPTRRDATRRDATRHDTRHTTHDTRHTTHDTRHTTHVTRPRTLRVTSLGIGGRKLMVNYMQLSVYERYERLWGESEKGLTFLDGKSVGPVCVGETDARRWHSFQCHFLCF